MNRTYTMSTNLRSMPHPIVADSIDGCYTQFMECLQLCDSHVRYYEPLKFKFEVIIENHYEEGDLF